MRIIKFRAWDKEENKMMTVDMLRLIGTKTYQQIGLIKDGMVKTVNIDSVDLMQSTGLKDRNGKEIYEGDIIRLVNKKNSLHHCKFDNCPHEKDNHPHMSGVGIVGWNDKKIGFAWCKQKDYQEGNNYYIGIFDWEGTSSIEIIGNVYGHPELLLSKEETKKLEDDDRKMEQLLDESRGL